MTDVPVDDDRLRTAVEAAERAAGHQREAFGERPAFEYKGRSDLLTEVDLESERRIVDLIEERHPADAVLAEESGADGSGEDRWIVDPLDGTTNFYHGVPRFAVSVAFERAGRLEVGVIEDVGAGDTYAAVRGAGAYRNGEPIQVSGEPSLDASLIGTGFGHGVEADDPRFEVLGEAAAATHGVRRIGAAALDLAYVAAGRFEGFYHHSPEVWDFAAGALLVREAGGRANPREFAAGEADVFLATNGEVHAGLRDLVA